MKTEKAVWHQLVNSYGVTVPKEQEELAIAYVENHYSSLLEDKQAAKGVGLTPKQYAMESLVNGIDDGEHMDGVEVTDLGNGLAVQTIRDQEIIEVDQNELKKALQAMMTQDAGGKMAALLKDFYTMHAEYNAAFFHGLLGEPLITIEKLDNRTLGKYTHGQDEMGITNHIRLNVNFVALNPRERVLEELRHEMIHQWQDEVLYMTGKKAGTFKRYVLDEEGKRQEIDETQKKRPKDWNNKDFKQMAAVVGIPADGDKCYGNPAKMPEPKSYNRKFACGCVASNGHMMTVWSTRMLNATCKVCKRDYVEVKKGGKVIQVAQSHVEKPGEDAVFEVHKDEYGYFERFQSKEAKDDFVKNFDENGKRRMTSHTEGVYQKGHNAYKEGFTHWVAFNVEAVRSAMPKAPRALKKAPVVVAPEPKAPAAPAKERSHTNPQDLIDLYREFGTIKAVAEYFKVVPGTIINQAKLNNVDFKQIKGEMRNDG